MFGKTAKPVSLLGSGLIDRLRADARRTMRTTTMELVPDDVLMRLDALNRADFDVSQILSETFMDIDALELLEKLQQYTPAQDDKLAQLKALLTSNPLLSKHKVLIFSEFMDTPATSSGAQQGRHRWRRRDG